MAVSPTQRATSTDTLHLPRILCLPGGGVNADIFKAQLRGFTSHRSLAARFRFVFAEAPFYCAEGVGVHPVYSDCGPFRRWFRWLDEHPEIEDETCRDEVLYAIESAMEEDNRVGATGEWVAILGFSQGAKLAASLLYNMQIVGKADAARTLMVEGRPVSWRFGIIFAGRAPLVALSESSDEFAWCQKAGALPEGTDMDSILERPEMRLTVPTVHVHGLQDVGLTLHRRLLRDYCAPGTTTLVEWDGAHRIPIRTNDINSVVKAILDVADEYGI